MIERERESERESRPKATTSNSAKQMFYIRWQLPAGGATNEALGEHIKLERGNNNKNNNNSKNDSKAEQRITQGRRRSLDKLCERESQNCRDFPSSHTHMLSQGCPRRVATLSLMQNVNFLLLFSFIFIFYRNAETF